MEANWNKTVSKAPAITTPIIDNTISKIGYTRSSSEPAAPASTKITSVSQLLNLDEISNRTASIETEEDHQTEKLPLVSSAVTVTRSRSESNITIGITNKAEEQNLGSFFRTRAEARQFSTILKLAQTNENNTNVPSSAKTSTNSIPLKITRDDLISRIVRIPQQTINGKSSSSKITGSSVLSLPRKSRISKQLATSRITMSHDSASPKRSPARRTTTSLRPPTASAAVRTADSMVMPTFPPSLPKRTEPIKTSPDRSITLPNKHYPHVTHQRKSKGKTQKFIDMNAVHKKYLDFTCSLCRYQCMMRNNYVIHMKNEHDTMCYWCKHCKIYFNSQHLLKTYNSDFKDSAKHKPKLPETDPSKKHNQRTSSTSKFQYKCKPCSTGFSSSGSYTRHMKKHQAKEDNERFNCEQCSLRFASQSLLLNHQVKDHPQVQEPTSERLNRRSRAYLLDDNDVDIEELERRIHKRNRTERSASVKKVEPEPSASDHVPKTKDVEEPQVPKLQSSQVPVKSATDSATAMEEYSTITHTDTVTTGNIYLKNFTENKQKNNIKIDRSFDCIETSETVGEVTAFGDINGYDSTAITITDDVADDVHREAAVNSGGHEDDVVILAEGTVDAYTDPFIWTEIKTETEPEKLRQGEPLLETTDSSVKNHNSDSSMKQFRPATNNETSKQSETKIDLDLNIVKFKIHATRSTNLLVHTFTGELAVSTKPLPVSTVITPKKDILRQTAQSLISYILHSQYVSTIAELYKSTEMLHKSSKIHILTVPNVAESITIQFPLTSSQPKEFKQTQLAVLSGSKEEETLEEELTLLCSIGTRVPLRFQPEDRLHKKQSARCAYCGVLLFKYPVISKKTKKNTSAIEKGQNTGANFHLHSLGKGFAVCMKKATHRRKSDKVEDNLFINKILIRLISKSIRDTNNGSSQDKDTRTKLISAICMELNGDFERALKLNIDEYQYWEERFKDVMGLVRELF